MTRGVLCLCDASRPEAARLATALALQVAAGASLPLEVAYTGSAGWEDRGWRRAWHIDAEDGRGAARAVSTLLESGEFAAIIAGDSPLSREVLGRLAGSHGLPLAGRVLSAAVSDGQIEVVRAVDEGRRSAKIRLALAPALVLVDPDANLPVLAPTTRLTEGETIRGGSASALQLAGERSLGPFEIAPQEADVVVSGGRGLGAEGFRLAEELATLLHGAVGASRVAVDLGWAPRSCQVGLTGQTVQPRLYIAAGISGAVHHTLGMKDSGFIVAINSDPAAPIFQFADAAIIGNAQELLSALIQVLKEKAGAPEARPAALARSVA